jgi:hypothetical protein
MAPADLGRIVARCLRKDREERYGSTRELVVDLEAMRKAVVSGTAASVGDRRATGRAPAQKAGATPLWWWQFHQVSVALLEYAMLYPMWQVRTWLRETGGSALFFCSLATVVVAATLRLNLWFASRYYRGELAAQRTKTSPWIRWMEITFVACVALAAVLVADAQAGLATLLGAVAIWLLVSLTMIEPATTRAAFRKGRGRKK